MHTTRGTTQIARKSRAAFRLQQALDTYAVHAEGPTGKSFGAFSSEGMGYFEGFPPGFHPPRFSMGSAFKSVFVIAFYSVGTIIQEKQDYVNRNLCFGSPERGAGPAVAGSEGSGFSLEKPPPEAEYCPGYSKHLTFAPQAQGLALAKPDPSVSCADSSPFRGAHLHYLPMQEPRVFFRVSMLMGLATWAFMPASSASWTSLAKALAVMATMGMVKASGCLEVRMALVAS